MFSDPDGTLVGSIDWRGIIDGREEPRPFAGLDAASDVLLASPAIAALLADRGTLLSWVESSERRAMVLGPVERGGRATGAAPSRVADQHVRARNGMACSWALACNTIPLPTGGKRP